VSVYPIVYLAQKGSGQGTHQLLLERIEQNERGTAQVTFSAEMEAKRIMSDDRPWAMYAETGEASLHARLRAFSQTLEDQAVVTGAATVAEAYEMIPLLSEEAELDVDSPGLKLINSGTIDRYRIFWGQRNTRYLKKSFARPVVSRTRLGLLPAMRREQGESPKIVVAGMTKVLECVADLNGEYLAGKSTTVVRSDLPLAALVGILNSDVVSFFYAREYGGNRLAGGYLRVGPPQLKNVPLPPNLASRRNRPRLEGISDLVIRIMDLEQQKGGVEPSRQLQLDRLISELDSQISNQVAELYGFDPDESRVISRAVHGS
jgi:hypothetical protein